MGVALVELCVTICVTLCGNSAELECGRTSHVVFLCRCGLRMADIKAELSLYCSCRFFEVVRIITLCLLGENTQHSPVGYIGHRRGRLFR